MSNACDTNGSERCGGRESARVISLPQLNPHAGVITPGFLPGVAREVRGERCGVFAVWGEPNAARLAYFGLFSLQHRGQESAGIAATDGATIERRGGMGLVASVFSPETLAELDAHSGRSDGGGTG
jgi:hypothetical protein